jgi:hypothetical protein
VHYLRIRSTVSLFEEQRIEKTDFGTRLLPVASVKSSPMPSPPAFPILPKVRPPPNKPGWLFVLPIVGIVTVIYFVHSRPAEKASAQQSIGMPGWDALLPCSSVISFNGKEAMSFFDTGRVSIFRDDDSASPKPVYGEWRFDAARSRYFVTFPGSSSTDYTVVSPEQSNSCVLVRGEVGTADLTESWFSAPDDADDDREPDR